MGKVEEVVRSVVLQVVRREVRVALGPLAKEVRDLKRSLARLDRAVLSSTGEGATGAAAPRAVPVALKVSHEEVTRCRITSETIKKLRAKLGITQMQLAALVGVTGPAIAQWEGGTSEPRGANRAAVVGLRKLGRKEVKRLLEERGIGRRAKA